MATQTKPNFPEYRCHKTVRALKIMDVACHAHGDPAVSTAEFAKTPEFRGAHLVPVDDGYAPIPVDADWFRKHNPKAGGYYVVYEDGYTSYSPSAAFESGYTPAAPAGDGWVGIAGPGPHPPHRTIETHKVNGCNEGIEIAVRDAPGHGGASHEYELSLTRGRLHNFTISAEGGGFLIPFQKGPVGESGPNGVTHESLIAIVIDRLQSFQRGPYACRDNALALTHLEDAMFRLQNRTRARLARGVEGTHAQ